MTETTIAPATTTTLQSRREYLESKGLAKPAEPGKRPGGRFSKAAHEEIERAKAAGTKFSDDQ